MQRFLLSCGLVAVIGAVPVTAFAQARNTGTSGSSGLGGSSGFGSSSGMGGSSGFGSSGFGSAGGMSGGLGSGMGGSGFGGASGLGGMSGQGGMGGQGMGMGGQGMGGQQALLGTNANQGQFLGRSAQGQGAMGMNGQMNQFGNTNRGGGSNRGGMNTMNSMFNNGGAGNSNANQAPMIRPRQRVAFDHPIATPEIMQTTLQGQITKLSRRKPELANVQITASTGGELVVRGAVKSESQAKLVVTMLKLEPGVRTVHNEMTFPPVNDAE